MCAAARLAHDVGFQFVDIKACHGYLLHEFLSARTRPGPFGGDFAGRTRLLTTIIERVRERIARPGDRRAAERVRHACRIKPAARSASRWPYRDRLPYEFGFGVDAARSAGNRSDRADRAAQAAAARSAWRRSTSRAAARTTIRTFSGRRSFRRATATNRRRIRWSACGGRSTPRGSCKAAVPELPMVGTGYSYLQDYLPHVAQAVVRARLDRRGRPRPHGALLSRAAGRHAVRAARSRASKSAARSAIARPPRATASSPAAIRSTRTTRPCPRPRSSSAFKRDVRRARVRRDRLKRCLQNRLGERVHRRRRISHQRVSQTADLFANPDARLEFPHKTWSRSQVSRSRPTGLAGSGRAPGDAARLRRGDRQLAGWSCRHAGRSLGIELRAGGGLAGSPRSRPAGRRLAAHGRPRRFLRRPGAVQPGPARALSGLGARARRARRLRRDLRRAAAAAQDAVGRPSRRG